MKRSDLHRQFSSLSDVLIYDLRVESVVANIVELKESARLQIARRRNPALYFMLEGEAHIRLSTRGEGGVLRTGDCCVIMYGDAHQLGDGWVAETYAPEGWDDGGIPDSIPLQSVGQGNAVARVLICHLDLSYMSEAAFANRIAPGLFFSSSTEKVDDGQPVMSYDPAGLIRYGTSVGGTAFVTAFASLQFVRLAQEIAFGMWRGRAQNARSSKTRRIAAIVREIRAHPHRPWTLAELAHHANISRSAFAEAFTEALGEAPMTFVMRERMERAARLLRTEGLSIQEIAARVGYAIEGSFARAFKRHWGVSPRQFAEGLQKES